MKDQLGGEKMKEFVATHLKMFFRKTNTMMKKKRQKKTKNVSSNEKSSLLTAKIV